MREIIPRLKERKEGRGEKENLQFQRSPISVLIFIEISIQVYQFSPSGP